MINFTQLLINLTWIIGKTKLLLLSNTLGKINDIINFYEKHPSISNIKTKYRGISNFSFRPISVEKVKKII